MSPSSRTPAGEANHCPSCGSDDVIERVVVSGRAACPECGTDVLFQVRRRLRSALFPGRLSAIGQSLLMWTALGGMLLGIGCWVAGILFGARIPDGLFFIGTVGLLQGSGIGASFFLQELITEITGGTGQRSGNQNSASPL